LSEFLRILSELVDHWHTSNSLLYATFYIMDEEEASPTDNVGLKRKLFTPAASSNRRETFQVPHVQLKALARRRISTNKSFDIIREQQKQNESLDRYKKPALSEV
jgi:hypothetical protein